MENKASGVQKSKRYQGYDMNKAVKQSSRQKKPWFWKVLGISLVITFVILSIVCFIAMKKKKEQTDYLSKINESNSISLLLEDHSNITITKSYYGLQDEDDHTQTRFLKMSENGTLYSYLKTKGLMEDYKEVLNGEDLYRFDGSFTYYYGFVADDFEKYTADIQAEVLQLEGSETLKEQTESSDIMKATLTYSVQAGDIYNKRYGFDVGTEIQKVLLIQKESLLVTSDVETVNGTEIYTYTVTFDGKNRNPKFYRTLKKRETTRSCQVFYDYKGDEEQLYNYTIPSDVYFTILDHEGFKVYSDKKCTTEFTTTQMQFQNPQSNITLFMKKGE